MGCNNDKVRSFLTKPKARLRAKYDKLQQAEVDRENNFNGMTMFKAKVIGLPREIGASVVSDSETSEALYVGTVSVMLIDGPSNMIPDPQFAIDAFDATEIIGMHETALIPQELLGTLKIGDRVVVQYEKPYINDTTQVPIILNRIRTDLEYGDKLRGIFDQEGGLEKFFTTTPSSTVSAAALAQARVRDYKIGDKQQVINGYIEQNKLEYVFDSNNNKITQNGQTVKNAAGQDVLIYTSTDANGGLAFIKHDTINFANKLKELAIAYYDNFKKPIYITSCYRSFQKQQDLYENPGPGWAAKPGTSNHGWGLAFDWSPGTGKAQFSDPEYAWLVFAAMPFGFFNAGANFKNKEAWHFEILSSYRNSVYGAIRKQ